MKKIMSSITAISLLSALLAMPVSAQSDEKQPELKEDVITYGGNLTAQQKDDVREKLGAKESYKSHDVSVGDVEKFTGVTYDHIYSSSVIEPKSFGKGVDVEVVTPDNITKVTEEQYTNAAISAGIQNAKIRVASTVEPTTGDGALTGIVKAYAEDGNDLNEEDVRNANQEMSDLANISEENKGNEAYSDGAMNKAVADMKEQVADENQKNGEVSEEKVKSIVNDVLKEKRLNDVISENQKNTIQNIISNVSTSKTLQSNPGAFKEQITDYQDKLVEKHGILIDIDEVKNVVKDKDLNTEENKNFLQKIWDAIIGFFQWLWNLVSSFL